MSQARETELQNGKNGMMRTFARNASRFARSSAEGGSGGFCVGGWERGEGMMERKISESTKVFQASKVFQDPTFLRGVTNLLSGGCIYCVSMALQGRHVGGSGSVQCGKLDGRIQDIHLRSCDMVQC